MVECPECGSKALTMGLGARTLMYFPSFSDDEGRWHTHDRNRLTQGYDCRKCGCIFNEITYGSCWCGWSGGKSEIGVIQSSATKETD